MSDNNSKIFISPADFTDTGQWRLIIYISKREIKAFLKHISDKSRPLAQMLSVTWPETESVQLLSNIENAIYDHPGLLDDYATEIILETSQVTLAPNSLIDNEEDSETTIFTTVFPGDDPEILSDRLPDVTALFTLARGIDSFIARTMPGSRIRSHLTVIAERFRRAKADGPRIYVDIREREIDIVAFSDEVLISASVQEWRTPEDIAYRILNLLHAYGLKPLSSHLFLNGMSSVQKDLTDILGKFKVNISPMILPVNTPEDSALPLAPLLQAFR